MGKETHVYADNFSVRVAAAQLSYDLRTDVPHIASD
jgi:hypothetical protein